jgi:hypothetical protein
MNIEGINELYEFEKNGKTIVLLGEYHFPIRGCDNGIKIPADIFLRELIKGNPTEKFILILEEDPNGRKSRGFFSEKGETALEKINKRFQRSLKNLTIIRGDRRREFSKMVFKNATYWDIISENNHKITKNDLINLQKFYPETTSHYKSMWKAFNTFLEDYIMHHITLVKEGVVIIPTGCRHTRNLSKRLIENGWKKVRSVRSGTNCIKI